MAGSAKIHALECDPEALAAKLFGRARRVLLTGAPGTGKSTLAASLARTLALAGTSCHCISADPGVPGFGVPGAASLGQWNREGWRVLAMKALCTLDAGRFRLPLVDAIRRLVPEAPPGVLVVDAPGVVRGTGAAELLMGLAEALTPDALVVMVRQDRQLPLAGEVRALGVPLCIVAAPAQARRPGKRGRARERTRRWDDYLAGAEERNFVLADFALLGAPPPQDVPAAWTGRQVGLLCQGRTVVMGEVAGLEGPLLRVRSPSVATPVDQLLVRDARRGSDGLLGTAPPFSAAAVRYLPPPDVLPCAAAGAAGGPRPVVRAGAVTAALVNGLFGDPLLHLRLHHRKRSLLFDLGEATRLPARIAHQVSDVFISHAHIDHIGGFLWLLRSRMGELPACRLYGPPGLTAHIAGLLSGILWDRIGARGPRFEVAELDGEHLTWTAVQAGTATPVKLGTRPVHRGVILDEAAFRVRAATLDHRTPVLAFAFEPPLQINIRKDKLLARGLIPGHWLGELKEAIARDDLAATVTLPDGSLEPAGALAGALALIAPGKRLVYATDLADTPTNRQRLETLARGAHTLFCEAAFSVADAAQATRTGHLTTRACGEIATAAGVEHLVPFHFSRRYEEGYGNLYEEIAAVCSRVVVPAEAHEKV